LDPDGARAWPFGQLESDFFYAATDEKTACPENFSRDPPSHKLPIPFPCHSHTSRDSYGSSMGMGVPLLGVPGIFLENLKGTAKLFFKWVGVSIDIPSSSK